ncbi:hypothetical protein Bbelb_036290 [Branchiostoma belcheri]|nr:hypothetical protein Bbelb_036290 [Branchiostoma belcheri]
MEYRGQEGIPEGRGGSLSGHSEKGALDSWSGSARGGCNQQKSVDFVLIVQSWKLRLETRRPQDPDRISARGSLRRRLYHQQKSVDLVVIVQGWRLRLGIKRLQNQGTWEPEKKAVTSGDQRTLCGYNGKVRGLVLHGAVSGSGGSKRRVQEGIPGEDGTLWSPAVLYGRFPEIDDSRRSEQRDCLKGFMY